jgi:hypothetical protein
VRRRAFAAAAAAALLAVSCWSPPFNEELSLSALAMGEMEKVYEFTSGFWMDPYSRPNMMFVPNPSPTAQGGVLAVGYENPMLTYLLPWSSGGSAGLSAPATATSDPVFFGYFGDPAVNPRFPVVLMGDLLNPNVELYIYNTAMTVTTYYPLNLVENRTGLLAEDLYILGLHLYPHPDPTRMWVHILASHVDPVDPVQKRIYELAYIVDTAGTMTYAYNINSLRFGLPEDPPPAIPADEDFIPLKVGYFHSPATRRSYINFKSGGEYRTTTWPASSEGAAEIPVREKILAVLATGEVLTRDGTYGVVYGPLGDRKYKFPLGELLFGYETVVGGRPTLFFSRMYRDENSGGNAAFAVYAIPTADLGRLR